MKWITREKVKVDRVACPWLIKKFVDPDAEYVFLPHSTGWASIQDGTVYDVPGCKLGHHGEEVSFAAILRKYGLTDPALALLAQIVRAADSHPSSPHPAGEGVKGGVKLDHCGGEKVEHSTCREGFGLKDLRGRLERRPASRLAGRVCTRAITIALMLCVTGRFTSSTPKHVSYSEFLTGLRAGQSKRCTNP